jgi:hypothetical protein
MCFESIKDTFGSVENGLDRKSGSREKKILKDSIFGNQVYSFQLSSTWTL